MRNYSFLDNWLIQLDKTLAAFHAPISNTEKVYPAAKLGTVKLTPSETSHAAGLMRVNHTGEVCAQALYQGQALTARDSTIKLAMQQAALDEKDHLAWCQQRLNDLHSRASYLNPLWYCGSLGLGIIAGIAGDKWSLGFLAETEQQVSQHLKNHLARLPAADLASRTIVTQMQADEQQHADTAINAGAAELPMFVKKVMKLASKLMTTVAYYV